MAFFKKIGAGTPEYHEELEISAVEKAALQAKKKIDEKLAHAKATIRGKWARYKLQLDLKKASKTKA